MRQTNKLNINKDQALIEALIESLIEPLVMRLGEGHDGRSSSSSAFTDTFDGDLLALLFLDGDWSTVSKVEMMLVRYIRKKTTYMYIQLELTVRHS